MSHRVLAANMWPALTFGNHNEIYQNFLSVGRPRFKNFLESILMYDEIYVPADSFISLTILVGVLGERAVLELLERDILKFVRLKGNLAYVGNGGGLIAFEIGKNDPSSRLKPHPTYGEVDDAVKWALSGLRANIDSKKLSAEVSKSTLEISTGKLVQETKDTAYRTILNSEELRQKFAVRSTHMDRLAGIEPNSVRVYGGNEKPDDDTPKDEIDTVLLVARSCLEAIVGRETHCTSIYTATPIGYVIESEESRKQHPYSSLQEISNIPDIGEQVLSGTLSVSELLRLRDSRHWTEFVDWFHSKCSSEPIEVAKAYVDLLETIPVVERQFARTLRFLVTSAFGIVNPLLGMIASAADAYLVSNVRESSPKYFIDELKQLTKQQTKQTK